MEIKNNCWVIVKKDYKSLVFGYGQLAETAKVEQFPLLVYNRQFNKIICQIKDIQFMNTYINLPLDSLSVITEEQALKGIETINKKFDVVLKQKIQKLKQKRIPINDRNIKENLLGQKKDIFCTASFVKTALRNSITNKSTKEQKQNSSINNNFFAGCCSFTKTTSDLLVYIPKTWLNYFGYNLTDLKSYISFLKKCDIDFEAEILGVVDLHSSFGRLPSKMQIKESVHFIKQDEKAYEILLKGKDMIYHTYINFFLLRYIINTAYWNIPFIAMKLKKNMPKATYWQCLLLAHNADDYNGHYSLATVNQVNLLYNGNKFPEINSPKRLIKNANELRSINQACTLRFNKDGLRDAIYNENYEFLQKFLNEN